MTTTQTLPSAIEEKNEAILEKLRQMGVHIPPKDAWKKTVGWAKDCPLHKAAVKAGAKWRAKINRQSILEAKAANAQWGADVNP
jgi:hypothetical protein